MSDDHKKQVEDDAAKHASPVGYRRPSDPKSSKQRHLLLSQSLLGLRRLQLPIPQQPERQDPLPEGEEEEEGEDDSVSQCAKVIGDTPAPGDDDEEDGFEDDDEDDEEDDPNDRGPSRSRPLMVREAGFALHFGTSLPECGWSWNLHSSGRT